MLSSSFKRSNAQSLSRPQRGFTLIELMIVVVVVAILGAIAVPSYLNHIRKTRRADAVDMFIQIQQAQERYRGNNAAYASNLTTLSFASNTQATTNGYYTMTITSSSSTGYVATATAVSGKGQTSDAQGSTSCSTLTVTVANGSATNTPTVCWSK